MGQIWGLSNAELRTNAISSLRLPSRDSKCEQRVGLVGRVPKLSATILSVSPNDPKICKMIPDFTRYSLHPIISKPGYGFFYQG